jgi:hypothetical protein
LVILGELNWPFFLLLFGFVYFFAVSLSIWAVVFEEITFHKYEKRRDVLKLIAMAFAEPILFHPLATMMNIKGNIDKVIGKNVWGKMERKGFSLIDSRSVPVSPDLRTRQRRIKRIALTTAAACIAAALIIFPVKTGYFSKTGQDTGRGRIFSTRETHIPAIEQETGLNPAIQDETPVNYHIIVGSFRDFGNARELSSALVAKGYPVRILASENAFFRVSTGQSAAREEAGRMLADIRSHGFESAWILHN